MGRSVRISEESAREAKLALFIRVGPVARAAWSEVDRALARLARVPKAPPKPRRPRGVSFNAAMADLRAQKVGVFASRKPSREEKRDRRAAIRVKVFARADGQCEGPALSNPTWNGRCANPATELQHVFGRGKGRMPESERNCLAACRTCHEAEGWNIPSSAAWWTWFAQWFQGRGFTEEAARARSRARFDAVRATSPAAPRTR